MTVAAIYARYSSDSQREESIEIQVDACTHLIESHGWHKGEVYTDYALSGTNDQRPGFQRCIADGVAGLYDVLVIYKNDRFARNVVLSKQYKQRLRDAGVAIWSVREGELKDTPDFYLHETMDEAFAEYYSRNLSVLIRQGNEKNAENMKASGVRIFGYGVDEDDRFVIDEEQARYVREAYERILCGQSIQDVVNYFKREGIRTVRGNSYSHQSVRKLLSNDKYTGVYRYAGHEVDGGMPVIIDKGTFEMVQAVLKQKQARRRAACDYNYILSGDVFCAHCGNRLVGQSGTSHTGRKYAYYACLGENGCGMRLPAERLEEAILDYLRDTFLNDGSVEAMVIELNEYVEMELQSSKWQKLKDERKQVEKERDRLVASIGAGVNPEAIAGAVNDAQRRLDRLEREIAREAFYIERLRRSHDLIAFVEKSVEQTKTNPKLAESFFRETIVKAFVDEENGYVVFTIGEHTEDEITLDVVKELEKTNPADRDGVRMEHLWWSRVDVVRTLFCNGQSFLAVIPLA